MTVTIRLTTREDYTSLVPIDIESQEKHADALPHIFKHGGIGLTIAVLKSHQKQGIGHLLFQQSIAWAKDKGATSLDLTVWEFNEDAILFYERHGMGTLTRQMTLPLE